MAYTTSQLDFAVHFLQTNPHTLLVTIDIGANDLFVLERNCGGATQVTCIVNGLPAMLSALGANLDIIYGAIRNTAHYHHQLVALTYYSLNYSDPLGTGIISEVNQVVADRTQAWGGAVADGFGAFKTASTSVGGNTCAAGLRIVLVPTPPPPNDPYDIHPSPAGRNLLAGAILAVVHHDNGNGDG